MKRKQLIALFGSISIALGSCAGVPANAEAVTEGEGAADSKYMETGEVLMEDEIFDEPPLDPPGEEPGTEWGGKEEETQHTEDFSLDPLPEETQMPEASSETEMLPSPEGENCPSGADVPPGEAEAFTEDTECFEYSWEDLTEEESEELEDITEEESEIVIDYEVYEEDAEAYLYPGRASGYYWDESWFISPDFRFKQVDKSYALADEAGGVFIYEKADLSSRRVGRIPYGGAACILADAGGDFDYVECGDIRGFAKKEELRTGDGADSIIRMVGEAALTQGDVLVEKADNEAFTYTKTTSYQVIAKKRYAMALANTWVYEYPDTGSRSIGDLANGSLSFILKELEGGWCFIESGDVRGFVPEDVLLSGEGAEKIAKDLGEDAAPLAEEFVKPEDNRSVYYTLLSVKEADNTLSSDICQAALSYVGNLPYVYGGTSLTYGADCSGFVQSIFASFGVNLPRTAQEQGANGQEVSSLDEAKPGDIIYYASGPHVGIYLGGGKVVECSGGVANTQQNPGRGPMISDVSYMPITSIRRYLIIREDAFGEGGNRTDDTPYTDAQLALIWAIVAQEDNGSYEGALAVITSAMNRTESAGWAYEGSNAYMQLTAPGQYCYSLDKNWVNRLGGNVPGYVKEAVNDCLKKGIRNHDHTSFRSTIGKATGANAEKIGGNWYFGS